MRIGLTIDGVNAEQLHGAVVRVLDDNRQHQAEAVLKAPILVEEERKGGDSGHTRGCGLCRVLELADSLPSVTLEIWASPSRTQPDVLQFIASERIDLAEWSRMGRPARCYPIYDSKQQRRIGLEVGAVVPVVENEGPLRPQMHIRCLDGKHHQPTQAAAAVVAPLPTGRSQPQLTETSRRRQAKHEDNEAFRFQIPTVPVTRNRRYRDARVGQIVRERRTDVIEALLPVIPVAVATSAPGSRPAMGKAAIERMSAIRKGLVLLQFSCQYTLHCVHELEDHSRNLASCNEKTAERVARLKQRSRRLEERAEMLRRESQGLSTSLNALRTLLQELDPEALAKLQDDLELQTMLG